VQLPLGVLRGELAAVERGQVFGATFALAAAGLGELPDDVLVPGAPARRGSRGDRAADRVGC
jgi:hypothetical protein